MFIYLFSVWSSHLIVSHLGVTDSGFFPSSIWNVSVFQAHPFFLRCCFLFVFLTCFKLSAWISYLVFKLEVVVRAECQMFRLSCLQHILMWIYWWMRRKFLIKSTVQSKTPISFDQVLKLLLAQSWSSAPCAALQMFVWVFCGIAAVGSCVRDMAGSDLSHSGFIPLTLSMDMLLLSTPSWSDSSEQNLTSVPSCALGLGASEAGWRLTAVHWWSRQNHCPTDGCPALSHPWEQNYSSSWKREMWDTKTQARVEATRTR